MKRTISLIITAMMLLSLMACQATPDEEFIVDKDTERMVEQAADESAGTKVSKLKVPDGNYTYQASAADGKLTINVDAPVSVPESEKIPTARVSETGLTQEQVTGFFNYLFPDEKPVTGDNAEGVSTKDEIQELILTYRKYIAEGTVGQYTIYTEDELKEEIKALEKEYASAPETKPIPVTHISDGTMVRTTIPVGDNEEEILSLDTGTKDRRISVSVPLDEQGNWENYLIFSRDESNGQFSDMNAVRIDETNWQAATEGKLNITYEDASKLCDGFFEAGNITDVVLSDAFVVDDEQIFGEDGQSHDAENYAYQFNYVRTVGDSPVANMSRLGGGGDEYSLPWEYEHIMFWVNDNGILYIGWYSHTVTGEIINDDTGVISFEEAQEIFKTMIVTTYGASEEWPKSLTEVSIDIDSIALSLVRVREQNASGRNGIYTPAWVFYGNVKQEHKDYDRVSYGWNTVSEYPFIKYPVLAINAIDGSIIDLEKGY